MKLHLLFFFIGFLLFTSCSTSKDSLTYFKDIDRYNIELGKLSEEYNIKIVPDDELMITVTSLIPEATAAYNIPLVNTSSRVSLSVTGQPSLQSYIVDNNGYIIFPILGKIKVAGKTTTEISEFIKAKIAKDVQDPYVYVQLINFKINVLGEVRSPGGKTVVKERYTIMDALADAGDLSEYGRRDNILLIREENGRKQYHRLNINDASILTSPYYYMQQNDIIYVEPNKIKKDNSKYNQNNSYKLSLASVITSAASIIASLVIALTVK